MKQQTKLRLNTMYGKRNRETLDAAVCEWCPENEPATSRVSLMPNIPGLNAFAYLCTKHAGEAASDFTHVNLYTLDPEPTNAYEALEAVPSEMKNYTVAQLEAGERYGVPYPVCGDLTTRKLIGVKGSAAKLKLNPLYAKYVGPNRSWTGHDPDGNQY